MDSINWIGGANFPNSTQTMEMLQGMVQLAGSLGFLGGDNYILKGCDDDNGIVSSGIIVLDGTLYIFEGGAKKAKVRIKEEKQTLSAFGKEYPEARTKRSVVFDDNGTHVWGDLKKVLTNKELETKIANIKGSPIGIVEMWVGYLDKIPENYRVCNGDVLSKDDFAELHKIIGDIHPGSTGSNNFALPDMRQMFVVGHDNRHPDYKMVGLSGGEERVTLKEEEIPPHSHPFDGVRKDSNNWRGSGEPIGSYTVYEANITTASVGGGESHENRPPFFVVSYIMKVKE